MNFCMDSLFTDFCRIKHENPHGRFELLSYTLITVPFVYYSDSVRDDVGNCKMGRRVAKSREISGNFTVSGHPLYCNVK